MFIATCPLILASASPRRQQLFAALGLHCTCIPATIDETPLVGETPAAFAVRMAEAKVAEVAAAQDTAACVIGADTVVTIDGRILGKPANHREALRFLELLNGKTHSVITGYALQARGHGVLLHDHATTRVRFGHFNQDTLAAYANTKEPLDKAGAYAIQGAGAFLVASIDGSCTNVIGLPVQAIVHSLLAHRFIRPGSAPLPDTA